MPCGREAGRHLKPHPVIEIVETPLREACVAALRGVRPGKAVGQEALPGGAIIFCQPD